MSDENATDKEHPTCENAKIDGAHPCEATATHAYTWPGAKEGSFLCDEHIVKLCKSADALQLDIKPTGAPTSVEQRDNSVHYKKRPVPSQTDKVSIGAPLGGLPHASDHDEHTDGDHS